MGAIAMRPLWQRALEARAEEKAARELEEATVRRNIVRVQFSDAKPGVRCTTCGKTGAVLFGGATPLCWTHWRAVWRQRAEEQHRERRARSH
jgi:hypothetical protein